METSLLFRLQLQRPFTIIGVEVLYWQPSGGDTSRRKHEPVIKWR
jgi:hypothetical protein